MGEVYKGHDPVLNRHVAIKVIAESLDTDSDLVERFRREARMAGQLNHPNIITIYDFVEEDSNLYIVMELLDGKDLKELIKSGSPLTVDQILTIMEQIADGSRLCPRHRDGASRPQARQHPHHQEGSDQDSGLRAPSTKRHPI